MTNPNDAIGTNGAYGGRTSVNALNDALSVYMNSGIVRGWECSAGGGMSVDLGGVTGHRDVAVATAPNGAKTTINNRTPDAVHITLDSAPASNARIDAIVAYVSNPPQGNTTEVDNPDACGIIAVKGTVSNNPVVPDESAIRSAITDDGATGSSAYYVVLATVRVNSGVTTITGDFITQGARAVANGNHIQDNTVTSQKIDFTTIRTTLFSGNQQYDVDLSESIANYEFVVISFVNNDGITNSVTVYNPQANMSFNTISMMHANDIHSSYYKATVWKFTSATHITAMFWSQFHLDGNSHQVNFEPQQYNYITKVVGYK